MQNRMEHFVDSLSWPLSWIVPSVFTITLAALVILGTIGVGFVIHWLIFSWFL